MKLLNIFLILMSRFSVILMEEQICPDICNCDIFMDLNRADCSYRNLINSNTEVPKNVEILDLSHNKISTVENNCFNGYTYLQQLFISHNYVQLIYLEAFQNMKKLTMIDLSYNRIEELDNRIFMENPALLELDLSGNKFMSFSDKPLILSDSLKILYLRDSKISDLYPATFAEIPALQELDLSDNLLITLNIETIANMPSLKNLNVKFNSWKCDDGGIETSKKWLVRNRINVEFDICKKKQMFEKMQDYKIEKKTNNKVIWNNPQVQQKENSSFCSNSDDRTCLLLMKCMKNNQHLEMENKDDKLIERVQTIFLIHVCIFLFLCGIVIGASTVYCILINKKYQIKTRTADTHMIPDESFAGDNDISDINVQSQAQPTVIRRSRRRTPRSRYHEYRNSTVFFIANLFNRRNRAINQGNGIEASQLLSYTSGNSVSNSVRIVSGEPSSAFNGIMHDVDVPESCPVPSAPNIKREDTPPPPYTACLNLN